MSRPGLPYQTQKYAVLPPHNIEALQQFEAASVTEKPFKHSFEKLAGHTDIPTSCETQDERAAQHAARSPQFFYEAMPPPQLRRLETSEKLFRSFREAKEVSAKPKGC